jgi:hypothetical protein
VGYGDKLDAMLKSANLKGMFATPRVAAGTAVSWLRRLRLIQPEHRRHQVHEQEESALATGACVVGYRVGSEAAV